MKDAFSLPLVVTADVQLHCHTQFAQLRNGRNSRLQDGLDCIEQAAYLADGGTLLINGDLFHDRRSIDVGVLHATAELFQRVSRQCTVVVSVGNHDQYLRDGRAHAIAPFCGMVTVIDGPQLLHLAGGTILGAVPFHPEIGIIAAAIERLTLEMLEYEGCPMSVLAVHAPVIAARMGGNRINASGLTLNQLRADVWTHVTLGHFHAPQQLASNVAYCGSPLQIDWSESGDEKRFQIFDQDGMTSVLVDDMPRFRKITLEDYDRMLASGDLSLTADFFNVVVPPDVQRIFPPNVRSIPAIIADTASVLTEQATFDVQEAIRQWCAERYPDEPWLPEMAASRLAEL